MWMIMMLFAMLGVFATYDRSNDAAAFQEQAEASTIAYQMGYWHNLAEAQCRKPGVCPAGSIAISAPPVNIGSRWQYGRDIQSVTDGNSFVVTHWAPGNRTYTGIGSGAATNRLYGPITAVLLDASYNSLFVGQWLASAGTISRGEDQSEAGYDAVASNRISIPQGFGGLNLLDREPLIVTALRH